MKGSVTKAMALMLLALLCLTTPLKSQGWVTISLGGGYPEFANLGLRVRITKQLHIGAYIGADYQGIDWSEFHGEIPRDFHSSKGAAAFYHFGGSSKHTELPPWYLRAGYAFVYTDSYNYIQKTNWADLRVGRALNFSKRWGMELDFGPNILLHENIEMKSSEAAEDYKAKKVVTGGGLRFFFRI